MIFDAAWCIGLIPLGTLVVLHLMGRRRDVAWWWLACAFLVSWFADAAARWYIIPPLVVSTVYPVTQSALVGAVLMPRRDAITFTVTIIVVALLTVAGWGIDGPDVLFRTVAWLTLAVLALSRWELGLLRWSLVLAFGLGWMAWLAYAFWPGWGSWGAYQAVRLASVLVFVRAVVALQTTLRLLPRDDV
ncbi:MAG: hypothetical protein LH467_15260 [Gemmatimonadaceae bacterium]|nr:hypothetical protein [Gemmatimonadaceae bacterium]